MCVCVCVCGHMATDLFVVQLSIHDKPTRGPTNKTAATESLIETHDCTSFADLPVRKSALKYGKNVLQHLLVHLLVSKTTVMAPFLQGES